jgi:gluconolactonase
MNMTKMREIVSGLNFPEGPIAMPDGSVILVEIRRKTLSRVTDAGKIEVICQMKGGPNGAAIGPDGRCYICNNGGFNWMERDGMVFPTHQADDYKTGRIEVVDLNTGKYETLYTHCDGHMLRGPNDIVFDDQGGFYFTDLGKSRMRDLDMGGVYYAKADGSFITEVAYPFITPNGVGLSPDGKTLYAAETRTARLWAFDIIAPGKVADSPPIFRITKGRVLAGVGGYQFFDSLAVDAEGNVCVATIINGGITSISPDGKKIEHVPTDDLLTTNICFGGPDLKTAYITLSSSGRLVACDWPRAGAPLNYLNM